MPEPVPALLSPRDLKALLDSGLAPLLIHLLPAEHFAAQRLPGAACACVYEAAFPEHMARVAPDRDAHVVVYGADQLGMDAATAAGKLARLGYGQVSVLEGGLAAWREAGLPVEGTGEPRDPAWEPLPGGEFAVDPAASRLEWFGRNKNGAHHGTLRIKAGTLRLAGGLPAGRFTLDMASIADLDLADAGWNRMLVAHLLSDDFFWAERFPEAVYEIASARRLDPEPGRPGVRVSGRLTLRGVAREQGMDATLARLDDGAVAAEAHFDLDRTRWPVLYGSARYFRFLGMHLVDDLVTVHLRLVARPA